MIFYFTISSWPYCLLGYIYQISRDKDQGLNKKLCQQNQKGISFVVPIIRKFKHKKTTWHLWTITKY